jgi:hypothetical protein
MACSRGLYVSDSNRAMVVIPSSQPSKRPHYGFMEIKDTRSFLTATFGGWGGEAMWTFLATRIAPHAR